MQIRKDSYEDIIGLEHHQSKTHPHMSIHDRAAQFAPFSALTGHGAAIAETARLTEQEVTLDEYVVEEIDEKLQWLMQNIDSKPQVTVTYFVPDEKKEGGAFVQKTGCVKKLDSYQKTILLTDDTCIDIEKIREIAIEK
ncbi:hypothetical protein KQI22_03975 [Kineothrix sp. MSJ-39]|uniref:hypothetical protein n=1 Tax=Kineothrix sp. MSJ-39 TaxID=2841533 RepID=UPI001C0FD4BA|nr:hypothetical protein [Kineothrix sp. MSJ-39]MBU5429228.1 hypothetical protein [Kineothrix sp. MSJ-39]